MPVTLFMFSWVRTPMMDGHMSPKLGLCRPVESPHTTHLARKDPTSDTSHHTRSRRRRPLSRLRPALGGVGWVTSRDSRVPRVLSPQRWPSAVILSCEQRALLDEKQRSYTVPQGGKRPAARELHQHNCPPRTRRARGSCQVSQLRSARVSAVIPRGPLRDCGSAFTGPPRDWLRSTPTATLPKTSSRWRTDRSGHAAPLDK
ncbi:hypothetical protein GN956_G2813 [Arapaima gigas]